MVCRTIKIRSFRHSSSLERLRLPQVLDKSAFVVAVSESSWSSTEFKWSYFTGVETSPGHKCGVFSFPGGKLEPSDVGSWRCAAVREFFEETNVALSPEWFRVPGLPEPFWLVLRFKKKLFAMFVVTCVLPDEVCATGCLVSPVLG